MRLIEAKITAMVGLGLGTMLVGLIPAWFARSGRQQWPLFVSSLLCFGGGVLLSTSLVHMVPEIRELVPEYSEYVELVVCVGFFTLYLLDELVHFCYKEHREHSRDGPSEPSTSSKSHLQKLLHGTANIQ